MAMARDVYTFSVDQAGDIGGNGVSRYRYVTADGSPASQDQIDSTAMAIHDAYQGMATFLAGSVTWAVQAEVDQTDENSGQLVEKMYVSVALPDISGGAFNTTYPAGTGGRINWQTGAIVNHRTVHGANYISPLSYESYDKSGAINGAVQGQLSAMAATIQGQPNNVAMVLIVYHRPPKKTFTGGQALTVGGWTVGTTPSSLRSRRS